MRRALYACACVAPGMAGQLQCMSETSHMSTDLVKMWIGPAAADAYHQRGFDFDEIWAWEIGAVDPATFWASIPDHVVPKLHFYNSGVDADFKSPANPVNIIRYGGWGRRVCCYSANCTH